MSTRKTKEEKERLIADYKASGLSMTKWCKTNGNMTDVKVGSRTLLANKYLDSQLVEEQYGNGHTNQFVYDENGNVTGQKVNGDKKKMK